MKTQTLVLRMSILIVFLATILYFFPSIEVKADEPKSCSDYGLPPKSITGYGEKKSSVQSTASSLALAACLGDIYSNYKGYAASCAYKCADATKAVQQSGSEETCVMTISAEGSNTCAPAICTESIIDTGEISGGVSGGGLSVTAKKKQTKKEYSCIADAEIKIECNCITLETEPHNP